MVATWESQNDMMSKYPISFTLIQFQFKSYNLQEFGQVIITLD